MMKQNNGEKKFSFNVLDALIIAVSLVILVVSIYVFVLGHRFSEIFSRGNAGFIISKAISYLKLR